MTDPLTEEELALEPFEEQHAAADSWARVEFRTRPIPNCVLAAISAVPLLIAEVRGLREEIEHRRSTAESVADQLESSVLPGIHAKDNRIAELEEAGDALAQKLVTHFATEMGSGPELSKAWKHWHEVRGEQ